MSWVLAAWHQRIAEKSYGVPDSELTEWRPWDLAALRKRWNQIKHDLAPWWGENSKEAYNTGLANAAAAFDNYKASRDGSRSGTRMGTPKRKRKRRSSLSCRFTTGTIRVDADRKHVTLPRLGTLKTHESTRLAPVRADTAIGIDLGVSHLAVLSRPLRGASDDQGFVANPRAFDTAQHRLWRACRKLSRRRGPDRRCGQQPSNRWYKANRERNRVHHRVANLRADRLHKLTTALAGSGATLVVEDLNVKSMMRNKRLASAIADASWGALRRMLTYKSRWRGGRVVVADRWFPSSKTCSDCGVVKTKLPLRVRLFRCNECGLVLDRDLNAARNLANLAQVVVELGESGTGVAGHPQPLSWKGRGADRKTRPGLPGGCEASTPLRVNA